MAFVNHTFSASGDIFKNFLVFCSCNFLKMENTHKWNMIECYIESGKNKVEAANLYFQRYPERRQPDCRIFERLQSNLCDFGSFCKPRSKTYFKITREVETINTIAYVTAEPKTSTRKIKEDLGISSKKAIKILKENNFRPYVIRKVGKESGILYNLFCWYSLFYDHI